MKKILSISLMVLVVASLIGCTQKDSKAEENASSKEATVSSGKVYEIKLASMFSPEMPETIALYKFEEIIEERSNGRIAMNIFPNCQLGSEEVFTDSLIQGVVDMALPGSTMAQHYPPAALGECPFLFRDWNHARSVLAGPIGQEVFDGIVDSVGVRGFGFTPLGFSIIASIDEPITKYEELKDRRFRVPPIAHFIEFAQSIHTNPVPNMLTEFYTSIEQGVADSCIVPYSILKATKVYELTPYIVETNDIMFTHAWYINEEFYQSLPEDLQKILCDSVKEAQNYLWDLAIAQEQTDKAFLQESGIKVNVADEEFRQILRDLGEPLHDWYADKYPGIEPIIEKIKSED